MLVSVNCLLTASSYPQYILAELMQFSNSSTHSGLTLSTGQANSSVSLHASLLCQFSPLLYSLLPSSDSPFTILLPSSSPTTLRLVMQLLYDGQCQGTKDQFEDVKQLLNLLGLNIKVEIDVYGNNSDPCSKIGGDVLFQSCDNSLVKADAFFDNYSAISKAAQDQNTFQLQGLPLDETYSQELFTSISVSAEDAFNTEDLDNMDLETADILISEEEVNKKSLEITELVPKEIVRKCRKMCYACNYCKYKGTNKSNLNRHIHIKHMKKEEKESNVGEMNYADGEHFETTSKEDIHIKTECPQFNSDLKPDQFPCDLCDYIAKQKGHLKRHIRAKHSLDRFECNLCEKTFSLNESLNRHIKSFHEQRSYTCPECEFVTTREENLKYHVKCQHSMETFICDQCGHEASTERRIMRHKRRVHEGISYPCTQCDHQSYDKSSLKYHMMSKHEKIRYQCDVCTRKFTKKTSLKQHIIVKHSMSG